jgi:hypothetical protein
MLEIFIIVALILAIIAGLIATFSPPWFRLTGLAVALVAVAMLLPHMH